MFPNMEELGHETSNETLVYDHDHDLNSPKHQSVADESELDNLIRHQIAHRFFVDKLADECGFAHGSDISRFLRMECGFLPNDPRFKVIFDGLFSPNDNHVYRNDITLEYFLNLLSISQQGVVLERAFRKDLTVPDFPEFCKGLKRIFEETKASVSHEEGATASYIPQLAKVNPQLFGMSVFDGQRFDIGDTKTNFCVQSCCKPLNYCMALEEHGEDKVHQHVGREPSGVAFNTLCMNVKDIPHNPMINAGAIMSCSLIKQNKPLHERFEHVMNQLEKLSGGFPWGFSNSVYLSEKATADQNFCLAYMMRGKNAFPENTNLQETLEFYFQCCSMETTTEKMAILGSTLASGGVCPLTGERVFSLESCRNCLSLMYSCGMYDYSGEWAFKIGIPAKSGVSGIIYAVIPDFGCITVYAPPLDSVGNSVRGIEFFKKLVDNYMFHNFDTGSFANGIGRKNPRKNIAINERECKVSALYAAAEGDLSELRRLLMSGVSSNTADYDKRTLLHLAASEGHLEIVKFLIHRDADPKAMDRWGGTPYSDAVKHDHINIVSYLERKFGGLKLKNGGYDQ